MSLFYSGIFYQKKNQIEGAHAFKTPKSRTKSKSFTLRRGRVHISNRRRYEYEKTHERET